MKHWKEVIDSGAEPKLLCGGVSDSDNTAVVEMPLWRQHSLDTKQRFRLKLGSFFLWSPKLFPEVSLLQNK